jgi:Peptidase family M28
MAAHPPPARARPRPGSLERPVNGRLYRGTWLLVGIPLLIAAFTVGKPEPLRPAVPPLPPTFDKIRAAMLARELARNYPDRSPGSLGASGARTWFGDQLAPFGLRVRHQPFSATIPGRGRVHLENLIVVVPGRSPETLAVVAHLDNVGTGPGANDNASGVAALIELARSYASAVTGNTPAGTTVVSPAHTLAFVATDGGEYGGLGADWFAREYRSRVLATVVLDSIAGRARTRLEIVGDTAREASPELVETASARVQEQAGIRPRRPSGFAQLLDLAFPLTSYEQGTLLARDVPAVTLTTAGARRPNPFSDTPERIDGARLAEIGRSTQELLRSLDQGAELVSGTSSFIYLGARVLRGWAVQLVLIAALLPFLITAVDLFARGRRRHLSLAPALRSYRSRLFFWLWVGAVFELFAVLGVWPGGASLPVAPGSKAAGDWPILGLCGLAVLAAAGWWIARDRLVRRRSISVTEEVGGHTGALLALGVIGLLVVATNPYALLLVLPSLHAWLWLPHVQGQRAWVRAAVFAAGFLGPLVLLLDLATGYGLGLDAPWYLLELAAVHYVALPTVVITLAWLAAAAQLAALAAGRYAPYPSAADRPALGPLRSGIRRVMLAQRGRRQAEPEPEVREL